MADYTISETFTLPSRGKIYGNSVSETVTLRSMTTVEEMRRLSHTDTPYKTLCDVIDMCTVNDVGISSYDMHIGDYQFLLHKLRIVTYGSDYPTSSVCPVCGTVNKFTLNLDDVGVIALDTDEKVKEFNDLLSFELPRTKKKITIKFQTPRDLDIITKEDNEISKEEEYKNLNSSYLLTLTRIVNSVDGKVPNKLFLKEFLRNLPAMDSNYILQKAAKINDKVGIDTVIKNTCSNPKCGAKYNSSFRITNEFFGPTIND